VGNKAEPGTQAIEYREATTSDVPAMAQCRVTDPAAGNADPRMAAYLDGLHHPHQALAPRIGYVAVDGDMVIGYIAGHETRRFDCEGEVQYLYVATEYRRRGIATTLLQMVAEWFRSRGKERICVNVNIDSPPAVPFYLSCGAQPMNQHWYLWPDIGSFLDR
jgi:GNAT superfamily N-acetyltransferase